MDVETISKEIEALEDEMVETLVELIKIPAISPPDYGYEGGVRQGPETARDNQRLAVR